MKQRSPAKERKAMTEDEERAVEALQESQDMLDMLLTALVEAEEKEEG